MQVEEVVLHQGVLRTVAAAGPMVHHMAFLAVACQAYLAAAVPLCASAGLQASDNLGDTAALLVDHIEEATHRADERRTEAACHTGVAYRRALDVLVLLEADLAVPQLVEEAAEELQLVVAAPEPCSPPLQQ